MYSRRQELAGTESKMAYGLMQISIREKKQKLSSSHFKE